MTSFLEVECLIFSEYQERPLLWNVILFSSEVLFKVKKKRKFCLIFGSYLEQKLTESQNFKS